MKHEQDYVCPSCQEPLPYDPGQEICANCMWWEEEAAREQQRDERRKWEQQEYERELQLWERVRED